MAPQKNKGGEESLSKNRKQMATPPSLRGEILTQISCHIDEKEAFDLANALRTTPSLTNLTFNCATIGRKEVIVFAEALETCTSLEKLSIYFTSVDDWGMIELGYLKDTGGEGVDVIAKVLKTSVSSSIRKNCIGNEKAITFAELLKTTHSLTRLGLPFNHLDDEGAIALAEALKITNSLKYLNLGTNNIGDRGAIAIAEALKTNCSLKTLGLSINDIGKDGAIAIAESLETNCSLKTLTLDENRFGGEGVLAFAKALKTNSSLKRLAIFPNSNDGEGLIAFAKVLKTNSSLVRLCIYGANSQGPTARSIFNSLDSNKLIPEIRREMEVFILAARLTQSVFTPPEMFWEIWNASWKLHMPKERGTKRKAEEEV